MKAYKIYIIFIFLLTACFESMASDNVEQEFTEITKAFQQDSISMAEIVFIPSDIGFRTIVTPDYMENPSNKFSIKITIQNITLRPYYKKLKNIVLTTAYQPTIRRGELRWGIIFYDKNNARIGAFYVGKDPPRWSLFGNNKKSLGAINSSNVIFDGDLREWLRNNFIKKLDY